jgi:4-hydroxymandelate oxidase
MKGRARDGQVWIARSHRLRRVSEQNPFEFVGNLGELEALARSRMERPAFDYYAGGAGSEWTLEQNRAAFDRWVLRPRYLVDVSHVDPATTLLGGPMPMPVLLAPTAFHRLAHPEGELATARGARSAGVTMCVSTSSTTPLEEIACTGVSRWFQLYVHRNRSLAERLVARAYDSGYQALVLTIDVPYLGGRERDVKNRMEQWFPADIQQASARALSTGQTAGRELFDPESQFFDASLTWDDIDWLRDLSPLPIVLKGVLTGEDATLAVQSGVDALVVSNHGGRQLDGAAAAMDVLPEVVEAVEGRIEVLVDGGVRRGADVVKALALGARAVLIGRPYLWGLAVDGEAGVRWVLDTLRDELRLAMALTGVTRVDQITRAFVGPAPGGR